nr:MAG TPA: hypothetical protein [Caudoviricetes sp.]
MRTQDISCYLLFWALGNGCLFILKAFERQKFKEFVGKYCI